MNVKNQYLLQEKDCFELFAFFFFFFVFPEFFGPDFGIHIFFWFLHLKIYLHANFQIFCYSGSIFRDSLKNSA